jgi:hypothetical protein
VGTVYWKYGKTPSNRTAHWYVFNGAVFSADMKSVTLTITDGGEGDDDLSANGVISDPGGPGIAPQPVDVRHYMPAANGSGYQSFVRVINTGTLATAVSVAVIEGASGVVGDAKTLIASLPAGAAKTVTATEVEAALGVTLAASDRPRLRINSGTSNLEVQSFLRLPNQVHNDVTSAYSGSSMVVSTYVPAAHATQGYVSSLRVINTGSLPSAVTVARIDPTTGVTGTAGTLATALPAGAAVTYTAQQVEAALGAPLAAADRPRLLVKGVASALEVQSFLHQPGGTITEMSGEQSGYNVDVRTFFPAANADYQSFVRIGNDRLCTSTWLMVGLLDENTGQLGTSVTLVQNFPVGAARTFSANEIEAALGVRLEASARPRLRVSSVGYMPCTLQVQSYVLQPDATYSEMSGAVAGVTNNVRTYVPTGYADYVSSLRVINTGKTATPVTLAYVDPDTGVVGTAKTLLASLPAGAARTFSSSEVEAALGSSISPTLRPRIQVSGTTDLEVQSFLMQPGKVLSEVSGGQ